MKLLGMAVGRVTRVAGLLLMIAQSAVQAQQPSPAQVSAIRSNCRSDFMANCSGVQPGGQEAFECLKRNVAKLSGGCKAAVSAITPAPSASPPPAASAPPAAAPAMPPAAATPSAPNPPVASTPPAAKAAPERKATPPSHAAAPAAAPPPAAAAPAAPAVPPLVLRPMLPRRRLVIMEICHADADRLCPSAPRIGPETLDCLAMKAASLSPTCYEALARVSRP